MKKMDLKVIQSSDQYKAVLHEAESLVARDPKEGSSEADRLELLTLLVEDYEKRHFPFRTPDPIEAIEFRMSEQGLRQKDLVPLLGSRSRVSEVLSRKRPLTVQMIRSLSQGLGISLETLIGDPARQDAIKLSESQTLDWKKFPIAEMEARGWFDFTKKAKSSEEKISAFLSQVSSSSHAAALFRRTLRGDDVDNKSYYSILAWTARVLGQAKRMERVAVRYKPDRINNEVLRELAQLSWFDRGPIVAAEFLGKCGVVLVIEPRLPNTLIDGAALMTEEGTPVIALTLRYDRVDYFWYTLLHELVHVWKHLNSADEAFIDRVQNMESVNKLEKEANRIASEALIPRSIWKRSRAFLATTRESIVELADRLHVHPAIVVGRLHHETGRYDHFREFLGQGAVRKLFLQSSHH
jgi:HTH-type transcriptional regulator / antitoxin HigA